ncbi:MAG: C10 family peptidase [Bacteroidales bacterium]|nr:C10 family peptidase [Bacteroidales bacterium]
MKKELPLPQLLMIIILLCIACSSCVNNRDHIAFGEARRDYSFLSIIPHDVHLSDIENYVIASKNTKSVHNAVGIIPVVDSELDTLLYIVNYEQGWQILSSDKRTPQVLAHSQNGSIKLNEDSPMTDIIAQMALVMKRIKETPLTGLALSPEVVLSNISSWNPGNITSESQHNANTQSVDDPPVIDFPDMGHWELIESSCHSEPYDSIEHLTSTYWSQIGDNTLGYYNQYCPLRDDDTYGRAPAGCVAVAGAQLLFYLHENFGYPIYAPAHANCEGNIRNYQMNTWGQSSTIWNHMGPFYGRDSIAVLLADIGIKAQMRYQNGQSSADTQNLATMVFPSYSVGCDYGNYDVDITKNSLLSGMPVLAWGRSQSILGITFKGHAFIIDGYKRTRSKTTARYRWVYDAPGRHPLPPDDLVEVTYGTPTITEFNYNLGWGYNNKDAWTTIPDEWVFYDGNDTIDFKYHRKMIYNFSNLNCNETD